MTRFGSLCQSLILGVALMVIALCSSVSSAPQFQNSQFQQLRIGILKSHPLSKDAAKRKAFIKAYSEHLGVEVKVISFPSLTTLIDAQASMHVHYAAHTAKSFTATSRLCSCIDAIARPVSESGANGFRSVLVTKKTKLGDPARFKVGYSRDESISGKILPDIAVKKGELTLSMRVSYGSVDNVVSAFERGDIDAFFGWIPVRSDQETFETKRLFSGFYQERLDKLSELQILWSSPIVYYGPHAVHKFVPDNIKQGLKDILLGRDRRSSELADEIEPYFSGGFEVTTTQDYWPAIQAYTLAINPGAFMMFDPLRMSIIR